MIKYYCSPTDAGHLYAETPKGWFSRLVFLESDGWSLAAVDRGDWFQKENFRNYLVPLNEEDVSGVFRRDLFWVLGEEKF